MKKDEKKRLFDALESRTNLTIARRVLAYNDFPRGVGWQQIRDKLSDAEVQAAADFDGLRDGLREMITSNDKTLRIYKIDPADRANFEKKFEDEKVDKSNEFAKAFPYPIADSVLANLQPQPAQIVSKYDGSRCRGLILSSIHIVNVREPITPNQVGVSVSQYDEIYGIKSIKYQTFDTVLISKKNPYIYVLTDTHFNQTVGTTMALHSSCKKKINSLIGKKALDKPENLFPTIGKLYNSQEGVVRRLHYTTPTGAGKQEWMRGQDSCLRDELAHKAGMTALSGQYTGYAIDVEWELDEENGYTPLPILGIHGSYRITYAVSPEITDASVRGCADQSELRFLIEKLMEQHSGIQEM